MLSKDLDKLIKEAKGRNLSKSEMEENIIEWTTFFRRNMDIFIEDYLEIPLHLFQKHMILTMQDNDITDDMASRGSSKSFVVGCFSVGWALLYSNCNILITSFTLNQSNNIIDEKIDKELSNPKNGISPVLRQLRIDGYMEIKKDQNTGAKYVEFGNGSKIFAVTCGESARGHRAQIVITDECVLIKKKEYEEIIEPTLTQRNFKGKPYNYIEEPKQIFLSSAKTKTNWMWKHLKNCVTEHYRNKRIRYGFFAVDIFTAVASGIQTKNQYIQRKKSVDDMSFEQEYLNIFLGSNDNSLFKIEDFEQNQILEKAFLPRRVDEVLCNDNNPYKYNNDEIRILVCDIAIATGNENDNTVFAFISINTNTGKAKLECIDTKNGLNSINQVVLMKRWFYEYKATYFMLDCRGVGAPIFDILTQKTFDEELGVEYPSWNVTLDKDLQISSDAVIADKAERAFTTNNSEEVVIPFVATSELNNQIHLNLRKYLRDGNIQLLKDETEARALIEEKDTTFVLKSSEEKAYLMSPFIQTKSLINEAISLETKVLENGNIKLHESNRLDTKDRYITLAMGTLLADKIIKKYTYDDSEHEFDESDFYDIYQY